MTIKQADVTINVKDMDKSISFYQSIGFAIKNRWGNNYAQLTAPGIVIGLHPASNGNLAGNSGNVSIGFTTNNIEETKSSLEQLSIQATERNEERGSFYTLMIPTAHPYILSNQNGNRLCFAIVGSNPTAAGIVGIGHDPEIASKKNNIIPFLNFVT